MSQFLGSHQNRLDAKGRVSVPAAFRAALRKADEQGGLILHPSHRHACIEAWPAAAFAQLAEQLEQLPSFSDEEDDLATTLFADSHPVEPDKEGRIMLPEALVAHAGLTDSVCFMGLGKRFQIWSPEAAEARRSAARSSAQIRGFTLPGRPAAGRGSAGEA